MKRLLPLLISAGVYTASLFLPALHGGGGTSLLGIVVGLLGIFSVKSTIAWFSNPIYFAALIAFLARSYKFSFWAVVAAILIGFDTFRLDRFPINEAGHDVAFEHAGSGFYLWELAFLILAASSWVRASSEVPDQVQHRSPHA